MTSEDEIKNLANQVFATNYSDRAADQAKVLNEKAPLAEELALLAFKDKNTKAWELLQLGIFGLPIYKVSSGFKNEERRRPFVRGDIVASGIRDICWDVEEAYLPQLEPPAGLVGEEASKFIEAEFRKRSVMHHEVFNFLGTADFNKEQERVAVLAYLHSVMVRIRTVHRGIMLALLPMEFHEAMELSKMLVDECGLGVVADAHAELTAVDIRKWGDDVDWHAPVTSLYMKAMLNWNLRTVTHPDSLWSFLGLFCIEWNAFLELKGGMLALRKRGIKEDMFAVLTKHGDGDPYDEDEHALIVRQKLGERLVTEADTKLAYSCIAHHQSLYHGFFDDELKKLKAIVG